MSMSISDAFCGFTNSWHSLCILSDTFVGAQFLTFFVHSIWWLLWVHSSWHSWVHSIWCFLWVHLNSWHSFWKFFKFVTAMWSGTFFCEFSFCLHYLYLSKKIQMLQSHINFSALQTFLNAVHIRIFLQLAVLRISLVLYLTTACQFILKTFFRCLGKVQIEFVAAMLSVVLYIYTT
jgi:hypothetical protein